MMIQNKCDINLTKCLLAKLPLCTMEREDYPAIIHSKDEMLIQFEDLISFLSDLHESDRVENTQLQVRLVKLEDVIAF